jgi:uncharacterized protein (TIGR02611 family)
METLKRQWFRIPTAIRKPLVLVIGMLFIIISPFTGVLPGPGGIPVFLIGVAILSTEFEWAQRLRDWTLVQVRRAAEAWKRHKVLGTLLIALLAACFGTLSFFVYRWSQTLL